MWQASFATSGDAGGADQAKKKTASAAKARIRPSIAGGMRGVDVRRVVASQVNSSLSYATTFGR